MSEIVVPQLIVRYSKDDKGLEKFEWTVVGGIPNLRLIGAIIKSQSYVLYDSPILDDNLESKLFIEWYEERKKFSYSLDRAIPQEPLVGYLELVKAEVAASLLSRGAQPSILGVDGRPMRT